MNCSDGKITGEQKRERLAALCFSEVTALEVYEFVEQYLTTDARLPKVNLDSSANFGQAKSIFSLGDFRGLSSDELS